ncbi:iron-containing alcohol dehydrogenase [Maribius pontilimi]|uniref:Iron-containing alcohol dehydrogenase n=1 Tax=Palleronia pontilimi TaxID=1964209 RepID=A0A934MCI1_9RHOB|nr:iron-containing alcohol dehydrogenase [Palleronia pontilimi]MBJ3762813.1 iron-containing alcohol dehydrogenase [Palleronia pontilimi]
MNIFTFRTASQIQFGRGIARDSAASIATLGKRVLLVGGGTPARSDWLADALDARGCTVARFSVSGEPDVAMVQAGVEAARSAGAQVVVSLGGGAVIDAGKAIAALVPATRDLMDHLEVVGKGLPLEAAPLPFVALPTTAGTGAEVTKNAVIGVPDAGRKVSLRDDRMLADMAIVDPALTDGCPKSVTLASGLDAVTQVIEPYLSTKANPLTDALCRAAIPMGLQALVRLMEGENPDARDALAYVSLSGGLALANAGLGAVHGLAGPIGGVSPAPHGAVCGALLPHILRANSARLDGDMAARMAEVQGWIDTALDGQDLADWSRAQGLPTLGDMGLDAGQFDSVAQAAAESSSMKGNPVALDRATLVEVLRAAA